MSPLRPESHFRKNTLVGRQNNTLGARINAVERRVFVTPVAFMRDSSTVDLAMIVLPRWKSSVGKGH